MIPTAQPALSPGETPTAQPALGIGATPTAIPPFFPGLYSTTPWHPGWMSTFASVPNHLPTPAGAILQQITKTRSNFPETFLWTNITAKYVVGGTDNVY